jgi:uncharacterized protein YbjT (DUF2867 family)
MDARPSWWRRSRINKEGATMITVFGASGNTGGAAASLLLGKGKRVRAVGRHPAKLAKLVQAGAESAIGEIEDVAFVRQALAGAEAAYLLIPPNPAASDFRAYQKRVVDALVAGVAAAGVRHVVLLSSIGAHHSAGTGPIVGVHDFEERLRQLDGVHALFVRAGFFMENVLMGLPSIKSAGVYAGPMPADAAVPMIAAADIGAYAGGRLVALDFTGKSLVHLLGPAPVSQTELVRTIGTAIGKPVRYVQVLLEEVEQGMRKAGLSPSVVEVFMEMSRAAGLGLVAPEPGGPVVLGTTPFATFVEGTLVPALRGS